MVERKKDEQEDGRTGRRIGRRIGSKMEKNKNTVEPQTESADRHDLTGWSTEH